ncbi:MAG: SNF2-related protein, partial [Candidatus Limiplasma sp.]|nr:SNF2-related protein [Candidatus Limiplasma sp.]
MKPDNHFPVKARLFEHQYQAADIALAYLADGGGYALLMQMGTGKSLTSIAIVGQLWKERRIRKALIVAPLSILGVWEEEFQKFAAFGYELTLLTGSLARKAETIRSMSSPSLQVLVVNYESAWRLETELLRWHPDCIIADECHKIKTPGARASKAMHKLGASAKYRLALTGTVITNKPIDVFSQYKFADPSVFGGSF